MLQFAEADGAASERSPSSPVRLQPWQLNRRGVVGLTPHASGTEELRFAPHQRDVLSGPPAEEIAVMPGRGVEWSSLRLVRRMQRA